MDSGWKGFSEEPASAISSFSVLLQRLWNDAVAFLFRTGYSFYLFILPSWYNSNGTASDNVCEDESKDGWLISPNVLAQQLWEHAVESSKNVNSTIAEFMLNNFDINNDGHISSKELLNMTELLSKLPATTVAGNISPPVKSFWTWFSHEWPLMDWKIGVFLWQTFGGLLFVIAILSIMPGRLHTISGKILRWPILILIYLMINVELIVYVVIRIGIFVIETLVANPKHRALRLKINEAKNYEEWYKYASQLDASQKRDRWRKSIDDSTSYQYNWPVIKQLMKDMEEARSEKDPIRALAVLQQCTRKNVGGIMSEDLFTKTYTGEPKFIVTEFISQVTDTLYWLTDQTIQYQHQYVEDKNLHLQQQQQQQRQTISYEKNLQQQSIAERDRLWRSLIAFATLNFHNKPESEKIIKREKRAAIKTEESMTVDKFLHKNDTMYDNIPQSSSRLTIQQVSNSVQDPNTDTFNRNEAAAIVSPSIVNRQQLLKFLKRARASYGKTALCLSGGSMMGLYHLGHLKGLMETDCLPHIVSGCSAGSVIGAVLCTRTNHELQTDLDPSVIGPHLKCFDTSWTERLASIWKSGNLFSGEAWLEKIKWFACGDMTFEESYIKTGRILCIALSATTKKTPPILINYISAPNVTIASAVIASAAVPGFVSPQQLQIKDRDGKVRSNGPETYFDGSIRHDIPAAGLSEMLNCSFIVACQVNPHIIPFFFNPKGEVGRPSRWSGGEQETSWRGGFFLAALEMYLKNDMRAKFVFLRDLDAAVSFTGTMMTQSFEGSTTIVPQVELRDFFTLFSDPTVARLHHYLQVGSVAAYQHASMIRCHYRIADVLDECIDKLDDQRINKTDWMSESPKKNKISRGGCFIKFSDVPDIVPLPMNRLPNTEIESISSSSDTGTPCQ